ncbi:hypothetical protein LOZ57_002045 [Ophidiomyces ophidiicola]|uniref:uncharacterized protein n=1 Tax=Ophidiomyces ophidiicola TaxID=1387563 RepID=UPI0020C2E958|nr:uncharacterized protein LOZ57_002045 [Ophidiomyces ophidiicola]KAI1950486.1 hypothetical protein LOZ57_002045 [Ophidiomyces ophidiicola]KAI2058741.1 hypothetical protein LOZ43_002485 [Ophidiomyces ophidiicola]KAI2091139.1 hypothetical protein LOZ36_001078 [Ophidiomyces ophidiicola]
MRSLSCFILLGLLLETSYAATKPRLGTPYTLKKPECDCYEVSGPEPGNFEHYRFYDFRSIPLNDTDKSNNRGQIKDGEDEMEGSKLIGHHPSLHGHPFVKEWNIQNWKRPSSEKYPIGTVNSFNNIYATKNIEGDSENSTHLVLRLTRFEDYTSTAEVQTSVENVLYCSFRVRMRLYSISKDGSNTIVPPPPGAVAGMFVYHSEVSESDIEILTNDPPNRVHYANQPDWDPITDQMIPGASDEVDHDIPWTEWADHRLDWFPDKSRWYLNDELVLEKEYGVPDAPSVLVLNLWSNGGFWSGNVSVGQTVKMGIEWIQLAYNTSNSISSANLLRHNTTGDSLVEIADSGPQKSRSGLPIKMKVKTQVLRSDSKKTDGYYHKKRCAVTCQIDDVGAIDVPEVV